MLNLNIIPLGIGEPDDLAAVVGHPAYIIAEGLMVTYYSAVGTVAGTNIAVGICPVRSDYSLLDADSKSVGTYQKSPKNQFSKKGSVILKGAGGTVDASGVFYPTAVYNSKEKKFMVYYLGLNAGGVYRICIATGKEYNSLTKYTVSGATAGVVIAPAGKTIALAQPYVQFDKEENLYKLWYSCNTGGGTPATWLSTSKDGYDF